LNPASQNSAADSHRWVVFGAFAAVYFFVLFHRVSTSVVAPDLIVSFQTNATALGLMSSMYFYAYALEQPLVGYLSDRLGPRRVVGFWSLVAALGCILFGLAPSITWAAIGRGLIGFGVGGVYVPALKAFSQWFRQKEFTTMAGLLMAVGNTGAIVATTPLALSSKAFGWRMSFFLIAAITLSLALVVLLFTRDYDSAVGYDINHTGKPAAKSAASHKQVRFILTSINFWVLFVIFFGTYGIFVTLQGLWATPYLMSVLQADRSYCSLLADTFPANANPERKGTGGFVFLDGRHDRRLAVCFVGVGQRKYFGEHHGFYLGGDESCPIFRNCRLPGTDGRRFRPCGAHQRCLSARGFPDGILGLYAGSRSMSVAEFYNNNSAGRHGYGHLDAFMRWVSIKRGTGRSLSPF
jgi:MFS family permease